MLYAVAVNIGRVRFAISVCRGKEIMRIAQVAMFALLMVCAGAEAGADTLSEIKSSGILKIGYRDDIPPFSEMGPNGPQGFSLDICKRIAERVGKHLSLQKIEIKFIRVTAASRLQSVADGEAHIECGNTTSTLSRQEIVDFSNLFYVSGASFMTTEDVAVNSIEDVDGRRIAAVESTTTLDVLRKQMRERNVKAKLQTVTDHNKAVKLLEDGKVDMIAADRATLLGLGFASRKQGDLRLSPVMLSFEPYAFPVPRNDADFRLVVNRALSEVYLSGQVGRLWQKWFGRYEVKPTQLLLNVYRLNSLVE